MSVYVDGVTPLDAAHMNALVALPGGTVQNGKWLKGAGGAVTWASVTPADIGYAPGKITVGTLAAGPPGSPATNDIWIATDVDANGTCWHFRYNGASASAFKWESIGGPPAYSTVETDEATSSGSFVDLPGVGPSFTLVRAGDYIVELGANAYASLANTYANMGLKVAAAAADGSKGPQWAHTASTATGLSGYAQSKITVAASDLVKAQYSCSGGAVVANFRYRRMKITPVRVS